MPPIGRRLTRLPVTLVSAGATSRSTPDPSSSYDSCRSASPVISAAPATAIAVAPAIDTAPGIVASVPSTGTVLP